MGIEFDPKRNMKVEDPAVLGKNMNIIDLPDEREDALPPIKEASAEELVAEYENKKSGIN